MALLQVNTSFSLAVANKKDEKNEIDPKAVVNILSDNALLPAAHSLGIPDGIGGVDTFFEDQTSVYVVRSGDTLSQVANMFGVSVDTILSANDMKKGDKLKEGDILLILPFSGVEHTIAKGQTLQGIASLYKVDLDDILVYNDIDANAKLSIGEKLMIPGGNIPNEPVKTSSGSIAKSSSSSQVKNVNGYFINPVPSGRKTRGPTATHRGVDLGASTGSPIYASASGRVKFARTGYNGGFGNLVIISHPNGTETLYAHQSKIATSVGAQVSQGDVIGYVGSTGRSTGPHLHFEVLGAKNPGADWSWKY